MFYSTDFLCANNGLSVCWLASTVGSSKSRKLSKKMINTVDIDQQVDFLIHPSEPLALRLSSHLLLGILRVYKQQYEFYSGDVQSVVSKLHTVYKKTALKKEFTLDLNQLEKVGLEFEENDLSWDTDSNKMPMKTELQHLQLNHDQMDLDSINLSLSESERGMYNLEHSSNDMGGFDMPMDMDPIPLEPMAPMDTMDTMAMDTPMAAIVPIVPIVQEHSSSPQKKRKRSSFHKKPISLKRYFDKDINGAVSQDNFNWFSFNQLIHTPTVIPVQPLEIGRNQMDMDMDQMQLNYSDLDSQEVGRNVSIKSSFGSGSLGVAALQSESNQSKNVLSSDLESQYNTKAHSMRKTVFDERMMKEKPTSFKQTVELFKSEYKRAVPQCFMRVLVLASKNVIDLEQQEAFQEISIHWK